MPTLKELCIHLLQENVDKIDGPTGLPYDVMEPILLRASPTTLMNIEEYNQYLMEDTGIFTKKPRFSSVLDTAEMKTQQVSNWEPNFTHQAYDTYIQQNIFLLHFLTS